MHRSGWTSQVLRGGHLWGKHHLGARGLCGAGGGTVLGVGLESGTPRLTAAAASFAFLISAASSREPSWVC